MDNEPYLEKDIEKKVVKYAEKNGVLAIKLNVLGFRGIPDRLFLGRGAKVLFMEFKRGGCKPTKLQLKIHKLLREYGFNVFMADNVKEGKEKVQAYFKIRQVDAKEIPEKGN